MPMIAAISRSPTEAGKLPDFNHLLAGGMLLGLVAAFWSRIKTLGMLAMSRLVVRADLEDQIGTAMLAHCWTKLRRSRYGGARRYGAIDQFVRSLDRHQIVAFEDLGREPLIFWRGWRPLALKLNVPKPGESLNGVPVVITFLRGAFNIDELIVEAMDAYNISQHGTVSGRQRYMVDRISGTRMRMQGVYGGTAELAQPAKARPVEITHSHIGRRLLKWQPSDLGAPLGPKDPFEALALPPAALDMIAAGRRWLASEAWYRQKRIPWRMGWLLYGPPGTGKTSVARAIGQALDLPIFAYDLATFTNHDLADSWKKSLEHVPCIVLLEDLDGVFHGRDNVSDGEDGDGVTFDCLLNCISGVGDSSGVLVIVTTNRVDRLDEALGKPDSARGGISTRPGRIDWAVELPLPDTAGRRHIAARILADCPDQIESLVAAGSGDSGAQFEERCARVALDYYWRSGSSVIPESNGTHRAPYYREVPTTRRTDVFGRKSYS